MTTAASHASAVPSPQPSSATRTRRARGFVTRRVLGACGGATLLAMIVTGAWVYALPTVPVPPENPITESKRVLGKILFWDEQLSTSNVMSCGTCHQPGIGGSDPRIALNPGPDNLVSTADDRKSSFGIVRSDTANEYVHDPVYKLQAQATPRSANSMINAAYAPTLFWDGRATSQFTDPETGNIAIVSGGALESQALEPILSHVEMGHDGLTWSEVTTKLGRVQPLALASSIPSDINTALTDHPDYPELFRRAFGDTQITAKRIAFAIATYQRTLIADQTPFDAFQAGTGTMTGQQIQGFNVFFGANCSKCHFANNLTFSDHTFRNIGLRPTTEDPGRQTITGNPADRGKFKVPTLRNVGLKKTFMHNGQFSTLEQVLAFYAGNPAGFTDNRDPLMINAGLSAQNQIATAEFIRNGLTDPRVRNQTFPFDRPTLYIDRPSDQAQILTGAVAGSGGVAPRILAESPPLIGNLDYRLGLDTPGDMVGFSATLAISSNAPVDGRITPEEMLTPVTIKGSLALGGVATAKWPLRADRHTNGQIVYVQWMINDPIAPNGEARSEVARIRFFCGSQGCPVVCPADFDGNSSINADDIFVFLDAWFSNAAAADINGTDGVTADDIFAFLDLWFPANGTNCN